ncbi:hypothetical protein C7M84_018107 [Penaeus vannamei]|uniref:Uncharacterized protein n=1 Tax=Penaeus vannamei TaxID=6689 RepID=A0A423SIK1_PENVA|nr:hypothetical protein C7M84_018107 [Penaeus vannamei]
MSISVNRENPAWVAIVYTGVLSSETAVCCQPRPGKREGNPGLCPRGAFRVGPDPRRRGHLLPAGARAARLERRGGHPAVERRAAAGPATAPAGSGPSSERPRTDCPPATRACWVGISRKLPRARSLLEDLPRAGGSARDTKRLFARCSTANRWRSQQRGLLPTDHNLTYGCYGQRPPLKVNELGGLQQPKKEKKALPRATAGVGERVRLLPSTHTGLRTTGSKIRDSKGGWLPARRALSFALFSLLKALPEAVAVEANRQTPRPTRPPQQAGGGGRGRFFSTPSEGEVVVHTVTVRGSPSPQAGETGERKPSHRRGREEGRRDRDGSSGRISRRRRRHGQTATRTTKHSFPRTGLSLPQGRSRDFNRIPFSPKSDWTVSLAFFLFLLFLFVLDPDKLLREEARGRGIPGGVFKYLHDHLSLEKGECPFRGSLTSSPSHDQPSNPLTSAKDGRPKSVASQRGGCKGDDANFQWSPQLFHVKIQGKMSPPRGQWSVATPGSYIFKTTPVGEQVAASDPTPDLGLPRRRDRQGSKTRVPGIPGRARWKTTNPPDESSKGPNAPPVPTRTRASDAHHPNASRRPTAGGAPHSRLLRHEASGTGSRNTPATVSRQADELNPPVRSSNLRPFSLLTVSRSLELSLQGNPTLRRGPFRTPETPLPANEEEEVSFRYTGLTPSLGMRVIHEQLRRLGSACRTSPERSTPRAPREGTRGFVLGSSRFGRTYSGNPGCALAPPSTAEPPALPSQPFPWGYWQGAGSEHAGLAGWFGRLRGAPLRPFGTLIPHWGQWLAGSMAGAGARGRTGHPRQQRRKREQTLHVFRERRTRDLRPSSGLPGERAWAAVEHTRSRPYCVPGGNVTTLEGRWQPSFEEGTGPPHAMCVRHVDGITGELR